MFEARYARHVYICETTLMTSLYTAICDNFNLHNYKRIKLSSLQSALLRAIWYTYLNSYQHYMLYCLLTLQKQLWGKFHIAFTISAVTTLSDIFITWTDNLWLRNCMALIKLVLILPSGYCCFNEHFLTCFTKYIAIFMETSCCEVKSILIEATMLVKHVQVYINIRVWSNICFLKPTNTFHQLVNLWGPNSI